MIPAAPTRAILSLLLTRSMLRCVVIAVANTVGCCAAGIMLRCCCYATDCIEADYGSGGGGGRGGRHAMRGLPVVSPHVIDCLPVTEVEPAVAAARAAAGHDPDEGVVEAEVILVLPEPGHADSAAAAAATWRPGQP